VLSLPPRPPPSARPRTHTCTPTHSHTHMHNHALAHTCTPSPALTHTRMPSMYTQTRRWLRAFVPAHVLRCSSAHRRSSRAERTSTWEPQSRVGLRRRPSVTGPACRRAQGAPLDCPPPWSCHGRPLPWQCRRPGPRRSRARARLPVARCARLVGGWMGRSQRDGGSTPCPRVTAPPPLAPQTPPSRFAPQRSTAWPGPPA
jgi:hypothetical protein